MSDYLDTTRAERLTIAKIVDPSMLDIDTASKMLYRLWDDNFGMSKLSLPNLYWVDRWLPSGKPSVNRWLPSPNFTSKFL